MRLLLLCLGVIGSLGLFVAYALCWAAGADRRAQEAQEQQPCWIGADVPRGRLEELPPMPTTYRDGRTRP